MELSKNKYILIGAVVLIILGIGVWYQTSQSGMYDFPIASGDEVQAWDFQGAYANNSELEAKAQAEISRLNGLLGGEEYTDYELYISIANQHELLGDGKSAYDTLRKALALDSERTGLAWRNMGKLMERLGAIRTARIAYDNMVQAQPVIHYQEERIEFLKTNMPEDTVAIAQAEEQLKNTVGEFIVD